MSNEVDIIMDLDPLSLAKNPEALDALIAIMRNRRAMSEAGIKPKKETGPKAKLDLVSMGLKKSVDPLKRRVL
jgi:hypothetical protein